MKKIFAVLFMLGFIFAANAEIHKGRVDGNKTFYTVINNDINAVYVCEDVDAFSILIETVKSLGKPQYVFDDNKQLNSDVAVITKLHGNSETFINGLVCLNTYDKSKNTYQTYVW